MILIPAAIVMILIVFITWSVIMLEECWYKSQPHVDFQDFRDFNEFSEAEWRIHK